MLSSSETEEFSNPIIHVFKDESELQRVVEIVENSPNGVPFDDSILEFFGRLSNSILQDKMAIRRFPDLAAFAWWIRPTNTSVLRNQFNRDREISQAFRVPRGLVVHIAPSNVEILFAYSWAISQLCGCKSIVRLSSSHTEMSKFLVRQIFLIAHKLAVNLNSQFVTYDRENSVANESLLKNCDVLVVWGGDDTVTQFRKSPLKADSVMISFPDRKSLMILSSNSYLELDENKRDQVASLARRDVSLFGQQACSSPRSVVWIGTAKSREASDDFFFRWNSGGSSVLNLTTSELYQRNSFVHELAMDPNFISKHDFGEFIVCRVRSFFGTGSNHPGHGLLLETSIDSLAELEQLITSTDQTLAYFGIDRDYIKNTLENFKFNWPRRVVPIGSTADFDSIWDGIDLTQSMLRLVSIK